MPSSKRKRLLTSQSPITPRTSGRRPGLRVPSSQTHSVSSEAPQTPRTSLTSQLHTPLTTETKAETDRLARVTDDFDDHVIAAIDTKDHETVGCAYYSAAEEKLYLHGDTRLGGMTTIDACMFFPCLEGLLTALIYLV